MGRSFQAHEVLTVLEGRAVTEAVLAAEEIETGMTTLHADLGDVSEGRSTM